MKKRIKGKKQIDLEYKFKELKRNPSPIFPSLGQEKDQLISRSKHFHKEALGSLATVKFKLSKSTLKAFSPSTMASSSKIMAISVKSNQKIDQSAFFSLDITTKNWCLYDSNINKFMGFRQTYTRQVASLTKIMTTLLAIETMNDLEISMSAKVKITGVAASIIGTSAQLVQNTFLSLQDLLYGAMLPSGNDAAYTLAEYVGYFLKLKQMNENIEGLSKIDIFDLTVVNTNLYVQEFISRMKERAAELKLHSTRFSNPHGLQNALNISSAKDIALLSAEASKNELFKVIMSTVYHRYDVFEDESLRKKKQKKWWNTNKLLTKDWEGVKTGQTGSAGSCLSSLKQGVFIVVLNSSNSETRFSDTERIYNWYIDQKIPSLEVKRSEVSLPQRRTKTQFRYLQTLTTDDSL